MDWKNRAYLGFYLIWGGGYLVWAPLLLFVYFGFEEIFNVVKLFRIPYWDDVVSIDWCEWVVFLSLFRGFCWVLVELYSCVT